MGSALWAGISGLNASSKELDVIANNLANVNTIGYKSGTTFFADVLSQSISGGSSGSMQVGRGVSVSEVQTQFGAGSFETTGNSTDVAIDGDGFFMVNNKDNATFYTRAGAFRLNADGLLVDSNGYKVQGQIVENSAPSGPLTNISLQGVQSNPQVTTAFALGANLNSGTATGNQYNTTQTVYDSLGSKHTLNTTFTKTEQAGKGYWGIESSLDAAQSNSISADGFIFDSVGTMEAMYTGTMSAITATGAGTATAVLDRPGMVYQTSFTAGPPVADAPVVLTCVDYSANTWAVTTPAGYTNATVTSATTSGAVTTVTVSLDGTGTADITLTTAGVWADGDTASFDLTHTEIPLNDITVNFSDALIGGATIGAGGDIKWNLIGNDSLDITQYATASVIRALTADGYASGQLKTLSIDASGRISGFFTNGQTSDLAQIILASFPNPWGLKKMGSNLFGETVTSGSSIRNTPGDSGMGSLTPNTLEMSNTDIATEFIKMITAQKAYQANARVVTTQDTIMQELMNLKR
jgi:flagellar hook protein FlgE